MLRSLTIQHLLLIDSLTLPCEGGMSVLTGETGAGKSILLNALSLLLGKRADSSLVRAGCDRALISAEFEVAGQAQVAALLQEAGLECDDGALMIRRVIHRDGKSKCYVNDTAVGLSLVQQLAEHVLEIHGQHDVRGLLDSATHLLMLDKYGQHAPLLQKTEAAYVLFRQAEKELEALLALKQKSESERDYLTFVYNELSSLKPQPGEEENLANRRRMLQQREKLLTSLSDVRAQLQSPVDVSEALHGASRLLMRGALAEMEGTQGILEHLDAAAEKLQAANDALEVLAQSLQQDELSSLDEMEERLFALRAASRKYNRSAEELPAYADEVERQLKALDNMEGAEKDLKARAEQAKAAFSKEAGALSKARAKAAKALATAVIKELKDLHLAGVTFDVRLIEKEPAQWSGSGMERAEFAVRTNPNTPMGALHKIASGGELSRIMLALKIALSQVHRVSCVVFDEIDSGIGGATADAVGKKLKQLSADQQVMLITHQPQVASYADQHFKVEKEQRGKDTFTRVRALDNTARKEEVARMLSGHTITKEARAAAQKLMHAEA